MHRLNNVIGALGLAAVFVACGGGYSGYVIPQETELKPWVALSEDEILEKAGIDSIGDESEGEDFVEYEDYEDEGADDEDEEAPAPAPAPATPATGDKPAKPTKKPVK